MEKEEYPRTAITLEAIFGIIFGVAGIGHIYEGHLFSGIIIMLFRFALIGVEWVIFGVLSLATFGLGFLFGFLPFFVLTIMQNVIFGIISVYALKERGSETFAKICLLIPFLMGGLVLFLIYYTTKNQTVGLVCLFVALVVTAFCFMILFLRSREESKQ
jgi:hypothetical protein